MAPEVTIDARMSWAGVSRCGDPARRRVARTSNAGRSRPCALKVRSSSASILRVSRSSRPTTPIGAVDFPIVAWAGASGAIPVAGWGEYESKVLSATRRNALQSLARGQVHALAGALGLNEASVGVMLARAKTAFRATYGDDPDER